MRRPLNNMVIVIIGASSGIGRSLAIELDAQGARLALAARRTERLAALNRKLGGRHLVHAMDVARTEDVAQLMQRCRDTFGRLDTLVCNASFGEIGPVATIDAFTVRAMFACNVFGMLDCIQPAVRWMGNQSVMAGWRGQIVIVSSAAARRALPQLGVYCSTKAAQLSLAEALRVELMPQQIAVTSVHPIGTNTEFVRTAMRRSGRRPPRRTPIEYRQSAQTVARKIVRAIELPQPEVWTSLLFRLLMTLATLFPSITDHVMSRRLRPRRERVARTTARVNVDAVPVETSE